MHKGEVEHDLNRERGRDSAYTQRQKIETVVSQGSYEQNSAATYQRLCCILSTRIPDNGYSSPNSRCATNLVIKCYTIQCVAPQCSPSSRACFALVKQPFSGPMKCSHQLYIPPMKQQQHERTIQLEPVIPTLF